MRQHSSLCNSSFVKQQVVWPQNSSFSIRIFGNFWKILHNDDLISHWSSSLICWIPLKNSLLIVKSSTLLVFAFTKRNNINRIYTKKLSILKPADYDTNFEIVYPKLFGHINFGALSWQLFYWWRWIILRILRSCL